MTAADEIVPLDEGAARQVLENLSPTSRREAIATWGPDFVEPAVTALMGHGHRFAYCRDGEAQATFAGSLLGDVYFAFLLFADGFPAISPHLSKFVTATIIPAVADSPASRAESLSLTDTTTSHRWLRRLGAKPVEYLPGFGRQGEDVILWRWVREDEFGWRWRRDRLGGNSGSPGRGTTTGPDPRRA
jgi:hypothetical protein